MTTLQITDGKAAVQVTKSSKAKFVAHNAPKPNSITVACMNIATIAKAAVTDGNVTRLGHKVNAMAGTIDSVILEGKATSMQAFISAQRNAGLKVVNDTIGKYGPDTVDSVLAHRAYEHVQWCADTMNDSHGGFGSRLAKVGLSHKRAELANELAELASQLKKVFEVQYAPLYKARNKAQFFVK